MSTPAWARRDLLQANIQGAEQAEVTNIVSPFYDMETLGLNNFALLPEPLLPCPCRVPYLLS